MAADLLFHQKFSFGDDRTVEMKIWRVPQPVPDSVHAFKYSLFFGRAGQRIVGYDNERGKGDHRHYFDREEPYPFTTVEQLMPDFLADVRSARQ